MIRTYDRRDVLRAVGGASLLLLPLLRGRGARAATLNRLAVLYFPNGAPGTPPEAHFPKVTGEGKKAVWDWTGRSSEPLRPFEDRVAFHTNLRLQQGLGGAHNQASCGFITGAEVIEGEPRGRADGDTPRTHSLDLHVARATRTPLLYLAVKPDANALFRISWAGDDQPQVPEADPLTAYEVVFGDFVRMCTRQISQAGDAARVMRGKQRVLDLVHRDLRRAPRLFGLGAAEREKLQRYEEALERIEQQVMRQGEVLQTLAGACDRVPTRPATTQMDPPALVRAHADILVLALALGLRRATTLQVFHPYSNESYSAWLPVEDRPHHSMTHDKGYANRRQDAHLIVKWHMTQFAYVMGKLQSFKEGEATLLDHTVVVMGTDVPNCFTHVHREPMATMVAGGPIRGRTCVQGGMRENAELMATLCRAVGLDNAHFRKLPGYKDDINELL